MKCPKCGSENVNTEIMINGVYTCLNCGFTWQNGTKPEPNKAEEYYNGFNWHIDCDSTHEQTPEQKLMWLAENKYLYKIDYPTKNNIFYEITIRDFKHKEQASGIVPIYMRFGKTLEEAINAAYKWAKEQEDESSL